MKVERSHFLKIPVMKRKTRGGARREELPLAARRWTRCSAGGRGLLHLAVVLFRLVNPRSPHPFLSQLSQVSQVSSLVSMVVQNFKSNIEI